MVTTLTNELGACELRAFDRLARVLSDLRNAGHEIILVSSGAIAMGVGKLRLGRRPTDVPTKQAAAAVGQCELMYLYDNLFAEYSISVAQMLLTKYVLLEDRRKNVVQTLSFANVCNTFLGGVE